MSDCIFCRIIAGESPASFVYQDDLVSAFLDIRPINPGHLLVVPRLHTASMSDLPAATARHMMNVAQQILCGLRETVLPCEGVNLFLADGEVAGQDVEHVHLHVIPRYANDGFGLRFASGYGTIPPREELDAMAAAIRRTAGNSTGSRRLRQGESEMVHATLCFILCEGTPSCVLLGKKRRGFGMGKLNGIGGKLAANESPEDCIIREVREEVGLTIPHSALRPAGHITFRFPFRPEFDHFVYVFLAAEWEGEPTESAEMSPGWYPIHDIPFEQMWQDDAYWLPIVLNGRTVCAEFTFAEDNETVVSWLIRGDSPTTSRDPET